MSNRPETGMWNLTLSKVCGIGVMTLRNKGVAELSEDRVKLGRSDVQSCYVVTAVAFI